MSIGVYQLKDSLKRFIKKNKNRVNCSIEETHHLKKLDKPSGTAIEIENLIKDEDTLNLISLSKTVSHRKDDISGIHKVIFTDKDVTYTYTHKAISRDIFGNELRAGIQRHRLQIFWEFLECVHFHARENLQYQ